MSHIIKNIDKELGQAVLDNPYSAIDYERLLINDPIRIRKEEEDLSINEISLDIHQRLEVDNIAILSSDALRKIRCRFYRPKGKEDLPIYLFFHGGAFIYGTPEQYDCILCQLSLESNMLIVSVDYRLAPENPFPAAMEDGYEILLWLSQQANQIGGDSNKILIGGSSAGATIAASITHLARDKKDVHIQHQYLLYPVMSNQLQTDSMRELANAPVQTRTAAKWMWKHYLQDNIENVPKYAIPLSERNFDGLPGATIIVCEFDPLKDEGKLYAEKLNNTGVSVHLLEIKGAVHAFDFFDCTLTKHFYKQQIALFKNIINTLK